MLKYFFVFHCSLVVYLSKCANNLPFKTVFIFEVLKIYRWFFVWLLCTYQFQKWWLFKRKFLFSPPCTPKTYGDFWVFYWSFCWIIFFVYIFVTYEMTEKIFKRSVIYKLLAARKKCYRFFAKKREKHDPLSKKK